MTATRPPWSRLLARLSLPAASDPAAILPPAFLSGFGEAGSVYVANETAYDLYCAFDWSSSSATAYDLRVPAHSMVCWPVRCTAIAIAIDHTVHDPLASAIQVWVSEAALAPFKGSL